MCGCSPEKNIQNGSVFKHSNFTHVSIFFDLYGTMHMVKDTHVLKCLQGWDAVVLDAVAIMANRGLICIFNEAQVLVGPLPNLISLSTSYIPTSCMLICLWKGK